MISVILTMKDYSKTIMYYEAHKAQITEYNKAYREANKVKIEVQKKAYQTAYRQWNKSWDGLNKINIEF